MIQIPGTIPISIHPFFWLFASLIGWMSSGSLMGALIWVGIIFISVLIHEFGHALTALFFKQKAQIQLVALGGLTLFEGPKLKFWQQFIITFNGPLFGFFLFLLATALLHIPFSPFFLKILKAVQVANLFWTIVNLLPVLPLDGGQLLRIVLEAAFGIRGFKASLLIGTGVALLFSFYFFMIQAFLIGAFFFLFAFQSFDGWRKSRFANLRDRDEGNKELFARAEQLLLEGKKEAARELFEEVRKKSAGGILAIDAEQYLAFLEYKEGRRQECYDLLLPIKEQLSDESVCILHELAAERNEFSLVAELSARCYQIDPTQKRALDNARSFAHQGKGKEAGGWLQTAWQFGGIGIDSILEEKGFETVRNDPDFKKFIEGLS